MINFKGLKVNEYIVVADQLAVKLLCGDYICSNGASFSVQFSGDEVMLEKSLLPLVKEIKGIKYFSHYLFKDVKYSIEQVTEIKDNIMKNVTEDENGEFVYESLDEEFEVRKALSVLKEYVPQHSVKEDIKFEVELTEAGQLIPTGSKFIENSLSMGMTGWVNSKLYSLNRSGVAKSVFQEFVNKEAIVHYDESSLKFCKINGNYVYTEVITDDISKKTYFTSLAEAVEAENDYRTILIKHLKLKVYGVNVSIRDLSVSKLVEKLNNINSKAYALDVKNRHDAEHRKLLTDISTLLTEVKNSFNDLVE